MHNTVEIITGHHTVRAFKAGTRYWELILKFDRSGDVCLGRAMEMANRYMNGVEEDRLHRGKGRASEATQSGNAGNKQKRKGDPSGKAEVAAVPGQA